MLPTRFFRLRPTPATRQTLPPRRSRRPVLEMMEGRQLLSTLTVTNANDSGTGSLRAAIIQADADGTPNSAGDTINFNISGNTAISLASSLPTITEPVTIDATTQPGYGGQPIVVLDGANAGASGVGLFIQAPGVSVLGLSIDHFQTAGIEVDGGSQDRIENDHIGVDAWGYTAEPNGDGVDLFNTSLTSINNDVISGNLDNGVAISGPGSFSNTVSNSDIGAAEGGWGALANGQNGVVIEGGAYNNFLVGDVISGNAADGVVISGAGTTINTLMDDFIGTGNQGWSAVPNGQNGVAVLDGATDNDIGTPLGGSDVISGNAADGVLISGQGTTGNAVLSDFIGTNVQGSGAVPNGGSGVVINGGASGNTVGGTTTGASNVISDNTADGVLISDAGTSANVVAANVIGANFQETGSAPNGGVGVAVEAGASDNVIGGATAGAGNLISGNGSDGVLIAGTGTAGNLVQFNLIGTDATGRDALPNAGDGVDIQGASGTVVTADTIAYNGKYGIADNQGTQDVFSGNSIFNNGAGSVSGQDAASEPAPVLTSAIVSGSELLLSGTITGAAATNATVTIEFYVGADGTQGETSLGEAQVTTDASGDATFTVDLGVAAQNGQVVTATVTDASGITSAFSNAVTVTTGTPTPAQPQPDPAQPQPAQPQPDPAQPQPAQPQQDPGSGTVTDPAQTTSGGGSTTAPAQTDPGSGTVTDPVQQDPGSTTTDPAQLNPSVISSTTVSAQSDPSTTTTTTASSTTVSAQPDSSTTVSAQPDSSTTASTQQDPNAGSAQS